MKISRRTGILFLLLTTIAAVIALKGGLPGHPEKPSPCCASEPAGLSGTTPPSARKLPLLLDLGSEKCVPCKMMAPVLASLKADCAGKLDVVFIDVWVNPDAGRKYGVGMIPTQIFYNAEGNELFRHAGFYSREDILKKWKELGMDFMGDTGGAP